MKNKLKDECINFILKSYPYLSGQNMTMELCNSIFNEITTNKYKSYLECVNAVKKEITASRIDIYEDIIVLKRNSNTELSYDEKFILVRLINLVMKGKRYIIFNKDVLFIPKDYVYKYGIDISIMLAESTYKKYRNFIKHNVIYRKIKYIIKDIFKLKGRMILKK